MRSPCRLCLLIVPGVLLIYGFAMAPYIDSARTSFYRELTKGGRPKPEF